MSALAGLLGVVVGVLLTAWWQRRNWQLQKAVESFAALYEAGRREITLCAHFGEKAWGDPQSREQGFRQRLGAPIESNFLRHISQYRSQNPTSPGRGGRNAHMFGAASFQNHAGLSPLRGLMVNAKRNPPLTRWATNLWPHPGPKNNVLSILMVKFHCKVIASIANASFV